MIFDYAENAVKLHKNAALLHHALGLREFDRAMVIVGQMEWSLREIKDYCVALRELDRYRMLNQPLDIDLSEPS